MQEELGLGEGDLVSAAAGLGGGIGRCQSTCGAITGAVVAAGLYLGRLGLPREGLTQEARAVAAEIYRGFEERFGATGCRTLTGYDFGTPEGYERFVESGTKKRVCVPLIAFALGKVLDL